MVGPPPMDIYGDPISTDNLVWNGEKGRWLHPNGFAPNPFTDFKDIFAAKLSMRENVV